MKARFPVVLLLALPVTGLPAELPSADPPERVARLSSLSGEVSFRSASQDDWGAAALNYPLTTGDHLWTDEGSRSELSVGSAALRLGPRTAVSFLNLDDRTIQVRLAEGSLIVSTRDLAEDEAIEVDTPSGAVSVLRPGVYRVDVSAGGERTFVIVRQGRAEVATGDANLTVGAQDAVSLEGIDSPSYERREAPAPNDLEDWSALRDRRAERAESLRYVSADVVGWEDLDSHGYWRAVGEWGPVWFPSVTTVGWAPYRFGHWAWIAPWGWTWIDDAPWGFAPFHYGRWAFVNGAWGWVPGRIVARPCYAPALVAFVDGGSWSASLSIGGSGVAWFPLGPREVYVPPYSVSHGYLRSVNVTSVDVADLNLTTVDVRYVNRGVPGAVTAIPRTVFTGARPVAPAAVVVPAGAVARAPVGLVRELRPEPVRAPGRWARPPAAVTERPVASRLEPPSAGPRPQALVRPLKGEHAVPRLAKPAPAASPAPTVSPKDRVGTGEQEPRVHESAKPGSEPQVERTTPARGEGLRPAAHEPVKPKPEAQKEPEKVERKTPPTEKEKKTKDAGHAKARDKQQRDKEHKEDEHR